MCSVYRDWRKTIRSQVPTVLPNQLSLSLLLRVGCFVLVNVGTLAIV